MSKLKDLNLHFICYSDKMTPKCHVIAFMFPLNCPLLHIKLKNILLEFCYSGWLVDMFFQYRIQRHWKLNSKFVVACYRPTFLRYFHNNGFFLHKLLLIAICKLFGFRFLPQDTRRLHISMHCGIEQGNHGHVIETLCKNQSWHSIKLCSRPGLEDYVKLMLLS